MVVGPGRKGWEELFNKGQEADADISGSDTRREWRELSLEGMESHAEPAHLKPEFGSTLPVKEKNFF